MVDFLDVTLDLNSGIYKPYTKPNSTLQYVHFNSNHPPNIIKNIPLSINRRLSAISSNATVFNDASQYYQEALDKSGYSYKLEYEEPMGKNQPQPETKRNGSRNITWFNPPYSLNVETNIGKQFFKILDEEFPPENKLHKVFNRNTVKLSYSCMPSVSNIIDGHNKSVIKNQTKTQPKLCNCRNKDKCPVEGKCKEEEVIYQSTVKTSNNKTESYIGLCATDFKARFANHKSSFIHSHKRNDTELSKYVWSLKDRNMEYEIKWKILRHAKQYNNTTKRCNLCIAEKCYLIFKPQECTLNKRSELISSCRHSKKFLLKHNRNGMNRTGRPPD